MRRNKYQKESVKKKADEREWKRARKQKCSQSLSKGNREDECAESEAKNQDKTGSQEGI